MRGLTKNIGDRGMMRSTRMLALAGSVAMVASSVAVAEVPERPENIDFKPLNFEPPLADEYRHTLSTGVPVYVAPSREFPLVTISFTFKGGSYLDPADKVGLASMTGAQIRQGGTTTISAEDLDEKFDFLAASVSSFAAGDQSGASLNCLTSNLDESFALFMDMVRNPGFDSDRMRLAVEQRLEQMKQRNDDADSILGREWSALMYGRNHYQGRVATEEMTRSITVDDMRRFHEEIFTPGNLIVGVTGDIEVAEALSMLERAFDGWEAGSRMPDPAGPTEEIAAGVYRIEKDIPQGKVRLGMRGVKRDDPEYFPLTIMNDVLGGGGFTSRIMSRVRSDEGLAYGAGSMMWMPPYYEGEFRASYASKNRTVAFALKIIFEEIERMRSELVPEEELETARASFIETFPRTFESKQGMLNVFISDEWTGRDPSFWKNYRDNIRRVSAKDVQSAAKKHLHPDDMAVLVVGKWDEIYPGDLEGRASMADFFEGVSTELPLRDPLTQEPLPASE